MGRLEVGGSVVNDDGIRYELCERIGEGGFGETYLAYRLARNSGRRVRRVCVKVCHNIDDWHGEAFFGRLLHGNDRAVALHDSFVVAAGRGGRRRLHLLVFEYMPDGTVADLVEANGRGWSPSRVRTEVGALLKLLATMHNVGITHRDITPQNVFLRGGRLVLGDFGISRMTLDPRKAKVTAFTPDFVPDAVWVHHNWGPGDDVFQLGLLACTLLSGEIWTARDVKQLRTLTAPDDLKCWIWHATAAKAKKYVDALDAREALTTLAKVNMRSGRGPASLEGHRVVFTGKLQRWTRNEAAELVRRAGGHVQDAVGDSTTLLVRGDVRNGLNESEGRKLYAVRERLRLGQRISIVGQTGLERLLGQRHR
ncbi:protein kinase domain-containing protein [Rhodococcus aetherivorans]|uniref:Putative serine/threonine protein kinase n=2 Tax=Rhodococcus ruber TaxID=1830 RepID=A0A098BWI2_9NOCA|nr:MULTISPECIES: protein kinase [Rhodococcus]MCD2129413.1 protein kinase [Rhodococcus ruber]MCZ1071478.1 protein kinase [Rhodococcus sp. A5(2022)]MCZ4505843.1 protein kinase [Rhodococcus ruber]MCZ4533045.1 protein kinase [Rhodococcus ruber]MCZ4623465.1 protein kinase [Rhodococcus ruber]